MLTAMDTKMQIDWTKYMKEGLCFICGGKGHIGKTCPMRQQKKEIHAVEMAKVLLSEGTKIKEVKE